MPAKTEWGQSKLLEKSVNNELKTSLGFFTHCVSYKDYIVWGKLFLIKAAFVSG